MPKRHSRENVLARWHVNESTWRQFLAAVRAQPPVDRYRLLRVAEPFPAAGVEIVVRDDALFANEECVHRYVPRGGHHFVLRPGWLEITEPSDEGACWLLPVPANARTALAQVVKEFTALDRASEARAAEELAATPPPSALLRFVQRHAILVILGFFFVLLPLFVFGLYLVSRALDHGSPRP